MLDQLDDVTAETLRAARAVFAKNVRKAGTTTVSTSTGLVPYDLQAPAKELVPRITPFRNTMPRIPGIGTATNWKTVTAITGTGYDNMGWVPEGQRGDGTVLTVGTGMAAYATLSAEGRVTSEDINAARGFEDALAKTSMRTLKKMMLREENAIVNGNSTNALGITPTPTLSATGTTGTLPALTYSVVCVALTYEGWQNVGTYTAGIVPTKTVQGQDGNTYVLNGGFAQKSAAATQAVTLGQILGATVAAVPGAAGYAWYVGAAGSERLNAVTYVNSVTFSAPVNTTTFQLASALASADYSTNGANAYNGLIQTALKPGSGAYVYTMPNGVAGVGQGLTAVQGRIGEFETAFQTLWNTYRLSPTHIYVHAQERGNITNKVLSNASTNATTMRWTTAVDANGNITAGQMVAAYNNQFTAEGPQIVPIDVHPNIPPGTIIMWCDQLPAAYEDNNIPRVAELRVRADYHQYNWPQVSRYQDIGVYCEEALAVYFPQAMAVITNVGNL